jgi:ribosomal protein S18 acetylase RimI-like enzyme
MSAIHIRRASEADLPVVLALYTQPGMNAGDPLPLDDARAIMRRMATYPHFGVYVATQASRVVGTFTLLVMENLAHHGSPAALVESVVVDAEYRRQGVGRAMMRHAMDEARLAGCYKLCLSSNLSRTPAHRFYESLGFEQHGISFQIRMM